ncbi:hypothetical protein BHE74_00018455 [Ensete ventricosum]|nr:hypothetical protein BHE74_00018455 [Ensete ventricosum]
MPLLVVSGADFADVLSLSSPFSSPVVSRVGRMSSASSHSESRLVEMLTHKSRVLTCPSEDSRSSALVCVRVVALADPGTANALVAMQSNSDVESTVTTRRLVEVRKNYLIPLEYELHAPLPREHPYDIFLNGFSLSTNALKSGGRAGSRSVASPTTSVFASTVTAESLVEKRPSVDEGLSLRKRNRRETPKHQEDASGSTTRVPSGKGKEPVAMEEAPERGYTLRELCEVEDRVGAERYFATVMTQLKVAEGEDPLMPRWSTIAGSSQFWTEGPLSEEYMRGALHPTLTKQVYECSSEELMNRANKSTVWVSALSSIPFIFFLSFCLSFLFPSLRRGFILLLLSLTGCMMLVGWSGASTRDSGASGRQ